MRKSPTLVLLATAMSIGAPSAAFTQVPITDAALTSDDTVREKTTDDIKETDKKRHTVSTSVTCSMYKKGKGGDAPSAAQANPEIVGLVKRVAQEEGVDETLFMSLVYQESRFNPCAKSPVGATGLSQLMPGTAKDLGVDPNNIEGNLRGGARYLKQQLKRFNGNTNLALAAYNAGPGNVQKYGGIPPFKETQGYVASITKKWMPQFGGTDTSNIPMNYGGGSTAFSGARDSSMNAMATSQSITESSGNVSSWLQQLGQMQTGTIQDSWDQNSGARNANLEMMNQVIRLGATMAELMNSKNALDLGDRSGSSRTSSVKKKDEKDPETVKLCDPALNVEWNEKEQACVQKRERASEMQLMLSTQ